MHKIINRFSIFFSRISLHTIRLMNYLLPVMLIEFIWFAASFFHNLKIDALKAFDTYGKIAEYLMMSLLIITVCSVLFDISVHERDSRK